MSPCTPVPPAQTAVFNRAVCERLGIDPAIVSEQGFKVEVSGEPDDLGKVTLTAFLPADELLDMFNAAGRAAKETQENDR